jgi:hypothetical protein
VALIHIPSVVCKNNMQILYKHLALKLQRDVLVRLLTQNAEFEESSSDVTPINVSYSLNMQAHVMVPGQRLYG